MEEYRRQLCLRRVFDTRWSALLNPTAVDAHAPTLHFEDIPWPVSSNTNEVSPETLTKPNICSFLLFIPVDTRASAKEIIRSALLKFHPDKFESKVLSRVQPKDVDRAQEAAAAVIRVLNGMTKGYM